MIRVYETYLTIKSNRKNSFTKHWFSETSTNTRIQQKVQFHTYRKYIPNFIRNDFRTVALPYEYALRNVLRLALSYLFAVQQIFCSMH